LYEPDLAALLKGSAREYIRSVVASPVKTKPETCRDAGMYIEPAAAAAPVAVTEAGSVPASKLGSDETDAPSLLLPKKESASKDDGVSVVDRASWAPAAMARLMNSTRKTGNFGADSVFTDDFITAGPVIG
jgi:hypothetical protein